MVCDVTSPISSAPAPLANRPNSFLVNQLACYNLCLSRTHPGRQSLWISSWNYLYPTDMMPLWSLSTSLLNVLISSLPPPIFLRKVLHSFFVTTFGVITDGPLRSFPIVVLNSLPTSLKP